MPNLAVRSLSEDLAPSSAELLLRSEAIGLARDAYAHAFAFAISVMLGALLAIAVAFPALGLLRGVSTRR